MLELSVGLFSGDDILGVFEVWRGLLIAVADELCENDMRELSVRSCRIGEEARAEVCVRGFFGTSRAACEGCASGLERHLSDMVYSFTRHSAYQ